MRKIKFRMWIDSMKEMIYKVGVINEVPFADFGEGYEEIANYKDVKLMQFTGEYDINDEEIYEDDIVRLRRYLGTSVIPHLSGYDEHVEHFDVEVYKVIFQSGAFMLTSKTHGTIRIATGEMLEVVSHIHVEDFDDFEQKHNNPEKYYEDMI